MCRVVDTRLFWLQRLPHFLHSLCFFSILLSLCGFLHTQAQKRRYKSMPGRRTEEEFPPYHFHPTHTHSLFTNFSCITLRGRETRNYIVPCGWPLYLVEKIKLNGAQERKALLHILTYTFFSSWIDPFTLTLSSLYFSLPPKNLFFP